LAPSSVRWTLIECDGMKHGGKDVGGFMRKLHGSKKVSGPRTREGLGRSQNSKVTQVLQRRALLQALRAFVIQAFVIQGSYPNSLTYFCSSRWLILM